MTFELTPDKDNKKVEVMLGRLEKHSQRGIRQGFYQLGADLRTSVRKDILDKTGKTGRTYVVQRGGRRLRHRASAPGEFSANLSGELRGSIGFNVRGWRQLHFGAGAKHGAFQEEGTSRMRPRENLGMTVDKNEKNAQAHFKREIKRAHKNETL